MRINAPFQLRDKKETCQERTTPVIYTPVLESILSWLPKGNREKLLTFVTVYIM